MLENQEPNWGCVCVFLLCGRSSSRCLADATLEAPRRRWLRKIFDPRPGDFGDGPAETSASLVGQFLVKTIGPRARLQLVMVPPKPSPIWSALEAELVMVPPKPSPIWSALETMAHSTETAIEVRGRIGDGPAKTIANLGGPRNHDGQGSRDRSSRPNW